MAENQQLKSFVTVAIGSAVALLAAVFTLYPPDLTAEFGLAFGTLLFVAIISELLALKLTEGGTTTSLDFVPLLGAVLLIGPAAAATIAAITYLFFQFYLLNKTTTKALFNTAQVTISVLAASGTYALFGGSASLHVLEFQTAFPRFLLAVIAYFVVNSWTVSYVVALSERKNPLDVWRQLAGSLIFFDFVMSPIAYLVAHLYVQWGVVALLAAILPIIGLRHSYGVNLKLKQLNRDLLRVLIKALEAQDPYTSGHSIRVAETAKTIALELGLRGSAVHNIETAALLHDIGKVGSAFGEILRQDGPLTDEQWEIIKEHPQRGVNIIQSVRSIDPNVLDCVLHHHERWDGDGYPAGLSGEAIPLGARIIMVADTIDAMAKERPYRKALSEEKIRSELRNCSGTQFDPELVRVTLSLDLIHSQASEPILA